MKKLLLGVLALSTTIALTGCSQSKLVIDGDVLLRVWDDTPTKVKVPKKIKTIADEAFYMYHNLEEVIIPGNVETIGKGAFCGCDNLETVTLSEGLVTIGRKAFASCESLYEITIPSTVTSIGSECFFGCTWLRYVDIKGNIASIGSETFDHTALTNIVLPKTLNTIESSAFDGCDNLSNIYFAGTEESWNDVYISEYNNDAIKNAKVSFYSATQPSKDGNYWHYDKDGKAQSW